MTISFMTKIVIKNIVIFYETLNCYFFNYVPDPPTHAHIHTCHPPIILENRCGHDNIFHVYMTIFFKTLLTPSPLTYTHLSLPPIFLESRCGDDDICK